MTETTKSKSSSKSASAPAQGAGSVASSPCWTKKFIEEIARDVIYPYVNEYLNEVSEKGRMPKNIKELYDGFTKSYQVTVKQTMFKQWCETLGLEFETQIRIKTGVSSEENEKNNKQEDLRKKDSGFNISQPTMNDLKKFGGIEI